MKELCGCCEGIVKITPLSTANRPGLETLRYRVGTYATFLQTMQACLSNLCLGDVETCHAGQGLYPLDGLTTRDPNDPAIALLHGWATVADVLTFYQERIANEGYLLTATERRSILELARLVGYALRPGVAATVYLAFEMEKGSQEEIPIGTRAQSIPGPGELPQAFETSEALPARAEWNALKPRQTLPQYITLLGADRINREIVYFSGIATNLKPNDPLLFLFDPEACTAAFAQVGGVEVDAANDRTEVVLQSVVAPQRNDEDGSQPGRVATRLEKLVGLVDPLTQPPSEQPAHSRLLKRSLNALYATSSDTVARVLTTLKPGLGETLYTAWENAAVVAPQGLPTLDRAQALRVTAAPFGHNAPLKPIYDEKGALVGHEEWPLGDTVTLSVSIPSPEDLSPEPSIVSPSAVAPGLFQLLLQVMRIGIETGESALYTLVPFAALSDGLTERGFLEHSAPVGAYQVGITIRPGPGVRFVNALGEAPHLNVYVDGVLFRTVDQDNPTVDYGLLPGTHRFQFVPEDGDPPEETEGIELEVAENTFYTVAAAGTTQADLEYVDLVDDPSPPGQDAVRVRFIHVARNQDQHIRIVDPNGSVLALVSPGEASEYLDLELDVPELQIVGEDGTSLLTSFALGPAAGTIYDLFILGDGGNGVEVVRVEATPSDRWHVSAGTISFEFSGLQQTLKVHGASAPAEHSQQVPLVLVEIADETPGMKDAELRWPISPYGKVQATIRGRQVLLDWSSPRSPSISYRAPAPLTADEATAWQRTLVLDAVYEQITPQSCIVIERPDPDEPGQSETLIRKVLDVRPVSPAAYGISGKATQLQLDGDWLYDTDADLSVLRKTAIYAQGEDLALAEEPIDTPEHPQPVLGDEIELSGLYDGLEAGRWVIVSGERADVEGTGGVQASELVMLSAVTQGVRQIEDADLPVEVKELLQGEAVDLPGDTPHTTIQLANDLSYEYKRGSVTVYGNVVKATHGETRSEVMGAGDGSQVFQRFELKQSPLTFVAAPTAAGAETTLVVRVNDVRWHEAGNLYQLGPNDRGYITRTDNQAKTAVVFGDGQHGARLPTGAENVKAVYRNGIGKPGNVSAGRISQLATRPLGVKGVINPLAASGGADKESRDQARQNVPLALMALDRLVSVRDYADFSRTFAGIGKASAVQLSDGLRELVHVTIAGADDIPIEKTSDLYRNLCQALRRLGDPYQALQVDLREKVVLVISAHVRLLPDYTWEAVEPQVRSSLLDAFNFGRRELGQDVLLSEVISVIQAVRGVAYVDVDLLEGIPEAVAKDPGLLEAKLETLAQPNEERPEDEKQPKPRIPVQLAHAENGAILRAQLATLSPDLAETLVLELIS